MRPIVFAFLAGLVLLGAGVAEPTAATRLPPLSQHFVSRPDLRPPVADVRTHRRGTSGG